MYALETFRDGSPAGLSSGLIRHGSRASAEDRTRPQLQVTDRADLPRTHVHRLGKRVGSRVRLLGLGEGVRDLHLLDRDLTLQELIASTPDDARGTAVDASLQPVTIGDHPARLRQRGA